LCTHPDNDDFFHDILFLRFFKWFVKRPETMIRRNISAAQFRFPCL
jgi:hypothetical protein